MMRNSLPVFIALRRASVGFDGEGAQGQGDAGAAAGSSGITLDQVSDLVNRTVNSAVANLKKSDLPKIMREQLNPLTEQLSGISSFLEALKTSGATGGQPQGGGGAAGAGDGKAAAVPPEVNVQLRSFESKLAAAAKDIENLRKERDEAQQAARETELASMLRAELSGLPLLSKEAGETAFMLARPHVVRGEDGRYTAGENLTVTAFLKEYIGGQHPYLLRSEGSSGSGARSEGITGRQAAGFDIGDIKPGMDADTRNKLYAALRRASHELNGGNPLV